MSDKFKAQFCEEARNYIRQTQPSYRQAADRTYVPVTRPMPPQAEIQYMTEYLRTCCDPRRQPCDARDVEGANRIITIAARRGARFAALSRLLGEGPTTAVMVSPNKGR